MKKRIFVTGAFGFIGSHIINELSNFDVEIFAVDRVQPRKINSRIQYEVANLLDLAALKKVLEKYKPDSIVHLAAIASPTYANVAELYDINVRGSENLLEAAQEVCDKGTRVVLTSTAGVYGNSKDEFCNEDKTPYNPQNHYSCSKMVMEFISKRYKEDLDVKIIRPFNILGMNQTNNFLIPKLIEAFVNKQEILRVGNLETARDFVDVEYTVKLFTQVAINDDINYDIINICNGKATKGVDIANYLHEITGYMPKIEVAQEFLRKNEIMRLVGDSTRCKSIMQGIAEVKPVKEILTDMVKQYQERL